MIVEGALKIEYPTAYLCYTSRRHVVQPPIARVNQQLRAETLPAFYSSRTFGIASIYMDGQWEIAKRWLTAVQPYLHLIKKIVFELCDGHARILELSAAPGQSPNFKLKKCTAIGKAYLANLQSDIGSEAAVVGCEFDILIKGLKEQLQSVCNSVGLNGFGSEEYIRAAELFLFPMNMRCKADYTDSDTEEDSDSDDSDGEDAENEDEDDSGADGDIE